jgi:UDP-N-acetyl-2-amino-2-deoxyglucuronate dehydrogenase
MKEKYELDSECRIYDNHEKMLREMPEIELVHICTPPYVHAQIAINSMNAGKNVVVEKPMATCLAECDAMLEAEERNHVTMGCNKILRKKCGY